MRIRRSSSTVLILSRVSASLSIIASSCLLFVLLLNQLLLQSLIMSLVLLFNTFVSSFVFPAIELRNPWLLVPQMITTVAMQILAIVMVGCAILELDGQKTILSHYQPYYEIWHSLGIDANIGCLCVWSGIFLLGNFVTFVHFRAFAHIRKSETPLPLRSPPSPPPYTIFPTRRDQINRRPAGAPPSYDASETHVTYTIQQPVTK